MTSQALPPSSSDEYPDQIIDLNKIFTLFFDAKWLIIVTVAIFALIGIGYAMVATPAYRANALIQIEEKSPGGVSNLMSDQLSDIFSAESSTPTEIQIIKSRMILGKTAERFHLDILVTPHYFPVVGKLINRLKGENHSIQVSKFDIPEDAADGAYKLVILDSDTKQYQLVQNDAVILRGVAGETLEKDGYQLLVDDFESSNGFEFYIQKRSDLDAIKSLSDNLTISEIGKQTGIVELDLVGGDPEQIEQMLDDIQQNYFLQSTQRNASEAEKSLEFLRKQLPNIKSELDREENQLNEYRQKNETIDLSMEAKAKLDAMVALDAQLNELTFKESEISQKFTKDHPAYIALIKKRNTLLARKNSLNKDIKNLPKTQREILRMTRDLEVDQQIYVQLMNEMQELSIVKAGAGGNVRILDHARSSIHPIKPNKPMIVIMALIAGVALSVGFVLARAGVKALLFGGVEQTSEFQSLGLPLYARVHKSSAEIKLSKKRQRKKSVRQPFESQLLVGHSATDNALKGIEALQSNLRYALLDKQANNALMITSPTESAGTSFIAANFAALMAEKGEKVLLIDADMRQRKSDKPFALSCEIGLSDYLIGNVTFEQVSKSTSITNLDAIASGAIPPNPAELLALPSFNKLLSWAAEQYDLVIIDTPDSQTGQEALVIGPLVNSVLLVARYGKTATTDIELTQQKFTHAGCSIKGVIFNADENKS